MLTAKCKVCGAELSSTRKVQFCGCQNQMRVLDDRVGAIDLNLVTITRHEKKDRSKRNLSPDDLKYQEERRKRRVRKLKFEER